MWSSFFDWNKVFSATSTMWSIKVQIQWLFEIFNGNHNNLMLIYQIYMTHKHEHYEVLEVSFSTLYGLNCTNFLLTTWNCCSAIVFCLDSKNLLVNMHHHYTPIVHNLNSKYQHKINKQFHVMVSLNSLPTIMSSDQVLCRWWHK